MRLRKKINIRNFLYFVYYFILPQTTAFSTIFFPLLPFPQDPRQVNEGRVQKACGDVNHVAGNCDGNQRGRVEEAGESEDVENSDVDRLAYEGGAVVAQPQKAALVSA